MSVRDLTTAPVGGLVRRLALPASVGFFLNTMYNVVDTFWAGRFHTDALAALSLSFPVFFILIAMGSGFSTGATALIGHALGEDDRRRAALYAAQGVVSAILAAVVIMAVGYAASPSLFRLLGADGEYLSICLEYLNVVLLGTPAVMLFYMFNGILNSQGDTHSFRDYMLLATVANVGLDPWFMYGGWGVPAMGVGGIALATVMMQAGGAVFLGWKAWRRFRWDAVSGVVADLAAEVSAAGRQATAAVFPSPSIARRLVRQDWAGWPLDAVLPMVYHSFYDEGVDWIEPTVREGVAALPAHRPLYAGLYLPALADERDFAAAVDGALAGGARGVALFGGVRDLGRWAAPR